MANGGVRSRFPASNSSSRAENSRGHQDTADIFQADGILPVQVDKKRQAVDDRDVAKEELQMKVLEVCASLGASLTGCRTSSVLFHPSLWVQEKTNQEGQARIADT